MRLIRAFIALPLVIAGWPGRAAGQISCDDPALIGCPNGAGGLYDNWRERPLPGL
jgi:hypothetical protein